MNISITCPTRGRPENMERLVTSIFSLAKCPENIDIIFYIDDDDNVSIVKAIELLAKYGSRIVPLKGKRRIMSEMVNCCISQSSSDIFMFCGDDIVFKTSEWDTFVLNEFEKSNDKILFVHGDDGIHGSKFGTHGFIHRAWIERVGYLLPPYFTSDWADTWINDIANKLNRRVYIDILTEHIHYSNGKSVLDETYAERLSRDGRDDNKSIYMSKATDRENDYLKLLTYVYSNENIKLKEICKNIKELLIN
jgi:hypothetical protein